MPIKIIDEFCVACSSVELELRDEGTSHLFKHIWKIHLPKSEFVLHLNLFLDIVSLLSTIENNCNENYRYSLVFHLPSVVATCITLYSFNRARQPDEPFDCINMKLFTWQTVLSCTTSKFYFLRVISCEISVQAANSKRDSSTWEIQAKFRRFEVWLQTSRCLRSKR